MFELSNKFFKDLGLLEMPKEFWKHSILTKPKNKKMECTASAEDFLNKRDFRYKTFKLICFDPMFFIS